MAIKSAFLCIAVMLICSCGVPGQQSLIGRSDAIVVLAGSYRERVPAAAKLYERGYAPIILLTNDGVRGGWSRKYQRNLYQIERAEELLVDSGVPQERIVNLPFHGRGTVYDALVVRRYARTHSMTKLLLVTSDFHVKRTLWTFHCVLRDRPLEITVNGVTSEESGVFQDALEWMKMLYYRLRFGMLGLLPGVGET